jgi:hypothetical protein
MFVTAFTEKIGQFRFGLLSNNAYRRVRLRQEPRLVERFLAIANNHKHFIPHAEKGWKDR